MGEAGIHDLGEGSSHVGIKEMLLVTGALTQRYFQHRDAFTHGCFKIHIYIYLRRDDFANAGTFTQRCFYTGAFTC